LDFNYYKEFRDFLKFSGFNTIEKEKAEDEAVFECLQYASIEDCIKIQKYLFRPMRLIAHNSSKDNVNLIR
jgi:hypothetical protein